MTDRRPQAKNIISVGIVRRIGLCSIHRRGGVDHILQLAIDGMAIELAHDLHQDARLAILQEGTNMTTGEIEEWNIDGHHRAEKVTVTNNAWPPCTAPSIENSRTGISILCATYRYYHYLDTNS